MPKPLGEKACFNRLKKYLEQHWSPEENDAMGFYNDIITEEKHTWKFSLNNKDHFVSINKKTGKITAW